MKVSSRFGRNAFGILIAFTDEMVSHFLRLVRGYDGRGRPIRDHAGSARVPGDTSRLGPLWVSSMDQHPGFERIEMGRPCVMYTAQERLTR
jgi:hypothetical protein